MKIFAFILALMLTLQPVLFAQVRNVQDNHQVVYNVIDGSGNHVTGQTVTIAIKKVSSGDWYDFSDDSFKASGWTAKTANLTEDATNGLYTYTYNPPASETAADQYLFLIDNADPTYGDHQSELVDYQDSASAAVLNRVDQNTNGEKDGGEYNGIENLIRRHGN